MNIVDSSGWLAYFADESNARHFLAPLSDSKSLVVPTVTIYEVCKVILRNPARMTPCKRPSHAKRNGCGSNALTGDCRFKAQLRA